MLLVPEIKEEKILRLIDGIRTEITVTSEVYTFPKEARYITEDLMVDLPDNAYIHKGLTGIGGTSLALTNNFPYVIAVPMKNLITNKTFQHEYILGVDGSTTRNDILEYLEFLPSNKTPKIMVTYDSVEKVSGTIDVSKFKLLVDEAQTLIQYAGSFKPEVCISLMSNAFKFKAVSFITATPTERKYLPDEILNLKYCEFVWLGAVKPDISSMNIRRDFTTKLVNIISHKLDESDDDIYVFYNSRAGVASTIAKLLKVEPALTIKDINVLFADTTKNHSFFNDKLPGIELEYKFNNNKRINFLSSMAFQGIDIYTKKNVSTFIVSDSSKRSMRYDIHIDLPQIVGRFRNSTLEDGTVFKPHNDIVFLWSTYEESGVYSEDEYEDFVIDGIRNIKPMIDGYKDSQFLRDVCNTYANEKYSPLVICTNPDEPNKKKREFIFNPLGYSAMMSVYASMHLDFLTFNNVDEDDVLIDNSRLIRFISDCFRKVDTYTAPPISTKVKSATGKAISYTPSAREYHKIMSRLSNEFIDDDKRVVLEERANEILTMEDDLKEHVEVLGYQRLSTLSFIKSKISDEYDDKFFIEEKKKDIIEYMNITIGEKYSRDYISHEIIKCFNKFEISLKPKASTINKFYETMNITVRENGKVVSGIKITGVK